MMPERLAAFGGEWATLFFRIAEMKGNGLYT